MVKRAHASFPADGIALHISVEDALVHGIKPGDPAVVEVTVRRHTPQEWIIEGLERTFQTEDEEAEFFGRCPLPGPEPVIATVELSDSAAIGEEAAADTTRIRWRSARAGN